MEKQTIAATEENIREAASETLYEVWACIDWDKVDRNRAYGIWDEFASKVKAAAMTTNSYEKFVEKLCRKMDVRSLRYSHINTFASQSEEFKQAMLKLFREETLQLVLEMRLNNELRKEMKQKVDAKEKEIEELNKKLDDTQVSFTKKGVKIDE